MDAVVALDTGGLADDCRQRLPRLVLFQFLLDDVVGFACDLEFLLGYFADDPDCETGEKLEVAREANHVVEEELEEYESWQALAAVIGKATGVKGDNRVHGWVVAVRSVESRDGMTARAQEIDWETLQRIQSRITGENENVSRVLYDVTHKPPATIEYE